MLTHREVDGDVSGRSREKGPQKERGDLLCLIAFSLLLLFLVVTKDQNLKYMIVYIMGSIVSATLVYIDKKY